MTSRVMESSCWSAGRLRPAEAAAEVRPLAQRRGLALVVVFFHTALVLDQAENLVMIMLAPVAFDDLDRKSWTPTRPTGRDGDWPGAVSLMLAWFVFRRLDAVVRPTSPARSTTASTTAIPTPTEPPRPTSASCGSTSTSLTCWVLGAEAATTHQRANPIGEPLS